MAPGPGISIPLVGRQICFYFISFYFILFYFTPFYYLYFPYVLLCSEGGCTLHIVIFQGTASVLTRNTVSRGRETSLLCVPPFPPSHRQLHALHGGAQDTNIGSSSGWIPPQSGLISSVIVFSPRFRRGFEAQPRQTTILG